MQLNKQQVADFRAEFEKAMEELAKKTGIVVTMKTIHYSEYEGTLSFKCEGGVSENGDRDSLKEKEFYQQCRFYGLEPKDYMAKFTSRGETYQIVGLMPSRRKYPILCKNVNTGELRVFSTGCIGLIQRDED